MRREDELRHLTTGPHAGEKPGGIGIVSFDVICDGDAEGVLKRAKEVMRIILESGDREWPVDDQWARLLPSWFVEAAAPEQSEDEIERWTRWWKSLPPDRQVIERDKRGWTLSGWLYWMEPQTREWWWWDAVVESPRRIRLLAEANGWPFPWGALRWLFRVAGARDVVMSDEK